MKTSLDKFIVFEGIDGSGKTTQIKKLSELMIKHHNLDIYTTREPHNGIIGNYIRDVLSNNHLEKHDPTIASALLAYLFAADRHEHIYKEDGVLSHLNKGNIVLCDRYLFSSMVYQGTHNNIQELTKRLNEHFPLPSLIVYFDISPKQAITQRLADKQKDAMEQLEVLTQVYDNYKVILEYYQKKQGITIKSIDASKNIDDISNTLYAIIVEHLKL